MTKILYGNIILTGRSGTEVVTLETALGLQRLGHEVTVLVSHAGPTAERLVSQGVRVVTDVGRVPWRPDIVHANHLNPALHAARRFPDVPQIFVGHDAACWHSGPARMSCVRRYCAVDELCAERTAAVAGVANDAVLRLPNAVDLTRFAQRGALPPRPRRALLVTKNATHIAATQAACDDHGIELDRLGAVFGCEVEGYAERLARYDLVFTTARTALEALAVGCAVVVVDGRGLAGMVASHNIVLWQRHNLGKRLLEHEPTHAAIAAEIARFDAGDARQVSDQVRATASLDAYLSQLLGVYDAVLRETDDDPLAADQTRAEFAGAFYAALPRLLEGVQSGLPAEEVAALAEGLPPMFGELWFTLSGKRSELAATEASAVAAREANAAAAAEIIALQATLHDTVRRLTNAEQRWAAAERALNSRTALLQQLWRRVLRGKRPA